MQFNLLSLKKKHRNPRKITGEQLASLKKSVAEFKKMLPLRPIVYDPKTNEVLGGNQRLEALLQLGYKSVPAEWVRSCDDFTEDEKRRFVIADNVGFGEWDDDILRSEWDVAELKEWGLELPVFDEIVENESKGDDFAHDEGLKTDIILGDLFEIGQHRLICGDSTDTDTVLRLMDGAKADICFTSPPYNGATSVRGNDLYVDNDVIDNKTDDAYIEFNRSVFENIKRVFADNAVLLYNIGYNKKSPSTYIDVIRTAKEMFFMCDTIVWEKHLAVSLIGNNLTRIYEFIFVFSNNSTHPAINKGFNDCIKNLWKISNVGASNSIHGACFPAQLVDYAFSLYGNSKHIVFEPFCGSGTTMVVAHQTQKKCYGIELHPIYCQTIIDRMRKLQPDIIVKKNGIEI